MLLPRMERRTHMPQLRLVKRHQDNEQCSDRVGHTAQMTWIHDERLLETVLVLLLLAPRCDAAA